MGTFVFDKPLHDQGDDDPERWKFDKSLQDWLTTIQIFGAKLVLEVFGGGGAIWGFSEACGLRNSYNVWFWRPAALTVAGIFLVRWLVQVHQHLGSKKRTAKRQYHGVNLVDTTEANALLKLPGSPYQGLLVRTPGRMPDTPETASPALGSPTGVEMAPC